MSHSQLQVLFSWILQNFIMYSCKECNQPDFGIDHLVMSLCTIVSWVVRKGCFLSPVCSLDRTLLEPAAIIQTSLSQACLPTFTSSFLWNHNKGPGDISPLLPLPLTHLVLPQVAPLCGLSHFMFLGICVYNKLLSS